MIVAIRHVLLVLAAAAFVSGCSIARVEGPAADDLSTWSEVPLPPDAALGAKALEADSACQGDPAEPAPMRVLVQDRRTQWSAAFLMAGPAQFGSCLITLASGASGGGSGPALGAMTAELMIDDRGGGGIGEGQAQQVGGRVVETAARVVVNLDGDRSVAASLRDGYWLAWWPGASAAVSVTAFDGAGAEIVTVEVEATP